MKSLLSNIFRVSKKKKLNRGRFRAKMTQTSLKTPKLGLSEHFFTKILIKLTFLIEEVKKFNREGFRTRAKTPKTS